MTELEKYEAVNKAKTLTELADVIRSFAIHGKIMGRTRWHNSENMAIDCENFDIEFASLLTREFGIRQQAMMLYYYDKL